MCKPGKDIFIAPGAVLVGNVTAGDGSSIWYNAVIRGDNNSITIGKCSNIQDNCTVHVDSDSPVVIGEYVTIGHNAVIHGCTIGDNTLIGMGAIILNNAIIGRNCIIGAGALVPEGKTIPDGSLVVGLPGRVVRTVTEEEIKENRANAEEYADLAMREHSGLRKT